jgi:hypothetical protein
MAIWLSEVTQIWSQILVSRVKETDTLPKMRAGAKGSGVR